VPELPEVETVRRGLEAHVVGREIADVAVLRDRAVRRHPGGADDLTDRLRGAVVGAAVRRGKYLWLLLAGRPEEALVLHLGMSGQLLVREGAAPTREPVADPALVVAAGRERVLAHLRARITFADGGELWFVDQRTFGHLLVAPLLSTLDGGPGGAGSAVALVPAPVAHIARDLLDPLLADGTVGRSALVDRVRTRRSGIKRALLDQSLVSGIGNIYADEGLWRAGEHYERLASRLSRSRVRAVLDGVAEVMRQALRAGGTSFDALYVNVNGASGSFDRSLAVYGRAGRPCLRCGTPVVRETFMNRSSFLCPTCQRAPRIRTTRAVARSAG
jgi:formamidopyrimidine-DNA glycosylase